MKYLKKYKLFEFYGIDTPQDMQEIGTHIDEILSDLTDSGIRVDNNLYHYSSHNQIFIYIYDVTISELRDPLIHLLEYMKDEKFQLESVHYNKGSGWMNVGYGDDWVGPNAKWLEEQSDKRYNHFEKVEIRFGRDNPEHIKFELDDRFF